VLGGLLARIKYVQAYQCLKKGEYDSALNKFTEFLVYWPNYAFALCNRALAYQALGEHSKAIDGLNRVIGLKPSMGLAYHNRGISIKLLGDLNRAIVDQTHAIALSHNDARVYSELGVLHMLKLEYEPAIVWPRKSRLTAGSGDICSFFMLSMLWLPQICGAR
jgi:tetratricopeptide (TPR) repeat protein